MESGVRNIVELGREWCNVECGVRWSGVMWRVV